MSSLAELLGESPGIQAVRATVARLLVHGVGDPDTGKGLLAPPCTGWALGHREMGMAFWLMQAERSGPSSVER